MTNLDLKCIKQHFNRAADIYDQFAVMQCEIGQRLFERLDFFKINPKVILDLGSGTGYFSALLQQKYPDALIVSLDLSENMLKFSKKNNKANIQVCANALTIPLAAQSVDLVFSNLVLHWCEPLTEIFNELKRILTKEGLLLFSMAGPDTFKELNQSFKVIDNAKHVHDFIDMHDIGDMLLHAHFVDPVMDMEMLTLHYSTFQKLVTELHALGISNCHQQRKRGLMTPRQFQRVQKQYESLRDQDETLPLSYEIVYGHAWAPQMSNEQIEKEEGIVRIPLTIKTRK